jgi:hypothetical protein
MGSPATFLARAATRRLVWPPLIGATLAALLFAALAVPRIDFEGAAADAIDESGTSGQLSPHERETTLATARRVGELGAYLEAGLGTGLKAMGAALALWLAFQVVGGRPDLRGSLSVACFGLVPGALERLLSIPALFSRQRVAPWDLDRLLPSSLGALFEQGGRSPFASLLWSFDLFALLAVVLVAAGMVAVAGVSLRRSLATTAVLWLGEVAVFHVALPAFGGPS